MRWLKALSMSEISIEGTVGFIITKASVSYQSEAFYGDPLQVKFSLEALNRRAFQLTYQVTNEATGKVVATAETGHVFFDYSRRAIASCPEKFNAILSPPI